MPNDIIFPLNRAYLRNRKAQGLKLLQIIASPAIPGFINLPTEAASKGAVAFDFEMTNAQTHNFTNEVLVTIGNSTSGSNRLWAHAQNDLLGIRNDKTGDGSNSEHASTPINALPDGQHKALIQWTGNNTQFWVNGWLVAETPGRGVPNGLSRIYPGQLNNSGGFNYNGTLSNLKIYAGYANEKQAALITKPTILSGVTYNSAIPLIAASGQSNAVGQAKGTASYPNLSQMTLLNNAMATEQYRDPWDYRPAGTKISALNDNSSNTHIGLMGYLANALAGSLNNDIAVVPAGLSSNGFYGSNNGFQFSSADGRSTGSRALATNAVAFAVCNQFHMASQFFPIEGIVWAQGEADVAAQAFQVDYAADLKTFIRRLRNALDKNIPVIDVGMSQYDPSDWSVPQANHNYILIAKQTVVAELNDYIYIDNTDLTGISGDEKHFSLSDFQTMAPRVQAVLEPYLSGY